MESLRRYNIKPVNLKWYQKLINRFLGREHYRTVVFVEIPPESSEYSSAQFSEIIIEGRDPFIFMSGSTIKSEN